MSVLLLVTALGLLVGAIKVLLRSIPAQNIFVIVGSLIFVEMLLQSELTWFGAFWTAAVFWPALIIWARIVTRWFLRRRRQDWNYGIWLIFLASALVALMQFALTLITEDASAALKATAFRFVMAAGCLLLLTPWLISKLPQQPHQQAQ
jgi:hypothetical protein